REAIDQVGDRLAERLRDLRLGDGGVLHDVVQQRGDERLPVEVPLGQDFGYCEGVRDVRLAGLARLPGMRRLGETVRVSEAGDVARLQVAEARLVEGMDRRHPAR